MEKNLKAKTISGMIWSGFGNVVVQLLQFAFSVVLARLLSPSDYGLTAILTIFYSFSMLFVDGGFNSALARKKDLSDKDISTSFYLNVVIGLLCYLVLFFIAPCIASFYDKEELVVLLRVYGLTILFVPFMLIQNLMLGRSINFKKISEINIISNIVSNTIAVVLAYCGYGVWALVFMYVLSTLVGVFLYWYFSNWRPKLCFSVKSCKYLFSFGYKIFLDGLISTFVNNLNNLVVGKIYSTTSLGFYNKAYTLASIPSSAINQVVSGVSFHALSKMQDNMERLESNYRRIVRMSSYMLFPLLIGLCAISHSIVLLMYTEKWSACIPFLKILCLSFLFLPILSLNKTILEILNKPETILKLRIFNTIIYVCVFCISLNFGIIGLCYGAVVVAFVNFLLNSFYISKFFKTKICEYIKDILSIFIISFFMGVCVYYIASLLPISVLGILISVLVGIVLYVTLSYLFEIKEFSEFVDIIKTRFILA